MVDDFVIIPANRSDSPSLMVSRRPRSSRNLMFSLSIWMTGNPDSMGNHATAPKGETAFEQQYPLSSSYR